MNPINPTEPPAAEATKRRVLNWLDGRQGDEAIPLHILEPRKRRVIPSRAESFAQPEETRSFDDRHVDLVEIAGNKIGDQTRTGLAVVALSSR